jgi:hypothetical protein
MEGAHKMHTPPPASDNSTEPEERAEFKPAGDGGDDPITRNLKRVYDDIASEPLPENLLKLLERLDEAGDKNG